MVEYELKNVTSFRYNDDIKKKIEELLKLKDDIGEERFSDQSHILRCGVNALHRELIK